MNNKLPLQEELDFAYLLSLMRPLYNVDEFSWLPELFTLLGHEKLINLCRYAGGEVIKIPTLDQLSDSVESIQAFYDVYISKSKKLKDIDIRHKDLVIKIRDIYNASND